MAGKIEARIVVAIDDSAPSRRAFDLAVTRTLKLDKQLVILTVGRRCVPTTHAYGVVGSQATEDSRCKQLLRRYGALAKQAGARYKLVFTHAEQGLEIGEALVNYLTTRPSQEVYLGRRSLSGFDRFFLGSVSKHVVENAPCNVTVVPCIEHHHEGSRSHPPSHSTDQHHKTVKPGDYVYTRVSDEDPDE